MSTVQHISQEPAALVAIGDARGQRLIGIWHADQIPPDTTALAWWPAVEGIRPCALPLQIADLWHEDRSWAKWASPIAWLAIAVDTVTVIDQAAETVGRFRANAYISKGPIQMATAHGVVVGLWRIKDLPASTPVVYWAGPRYTQAEAFNSAVKRLDRPWRSEPVPAAQYTIYPDGWAVVDMRHARLSASAAWLYHRYRDARASETASAPLQPTVCFKPCVVHEQCAQASPKLSTFSLAAMTGEMIDRRKATTADREAWSSELRQRIKQADEKERNRVLVDRDFEDWE